jgi:hypothetical protein
MENEMVWHQAIKIYFYFYFEFLAEERNVRQHIHDEKQNKNSFHNTCAAHGTFCYFKLCSICLKDGLGQSKPATNP